MAAHHLHVILTVEESERLKRAQVALAARMARVGIPGEVTYKTVLLAALSELEARIADWERKR